MRTVSVFICIFMAVVRSTLLEVPNEVLEVRGVVDDFINQTLNSLLATLDDPLKINDSYYTYNDVILTGWANISDFELDGLKSIVASYIDVEYKALSASSIDITIIVENLTLFFNYEASLLILQLLPYKGKGNISATVDTFTVSLSTMADVVLLPTSISNFQNTTIDISVGKNTSLYIGGIYYNEELSQTINDIISTYLPRIIDFIDSNQERISKLLSPILQDLLDKIFKKKSANVLFD